MPSNRLANSETADLISAILHTPSAVAVPVAIAAGCLSCQAVARVSSSVLQGTRQLAAAGRGEVAQQQQQQLLVVLLAAVAGPPAATSSRGARTRRHGASRLPRCVGC